MKTPKICAGCQTPIADDAPDDLCPKCLLQAGLGTGFDLGPESQSAGPRPPFVAPAVEEVARLFPQWEVLGLIGQGGMGAVYRVRQKELGRVAALKLLPPSVSSDPVFTERFTREARALAQLNHPGIVTLYEFGRAGGLFFFLMEYVDGVNLRQMLGTGRLAPREALAIVPQICDALQYAHDQGIVHRDIKPENLLVDRQGRVKVADFGLAKLVEPLAEPQAGDSSVVATATLTEAGRVMGTPQYMAPEQREHPAAVDHRADIYALGVVLYQMLTGELPGQKIEPPSKKVQIDVRLDAVVLRALEQKPDLRYQQASILKTQVETICATPAPKAATPPAESKPEKEQREKAFIILGTVILTVLFFVCLAMALIYPRQALLPLILLGTCCLGLLVNVIRLAGLWPFPSLVFPRPNFSSRNLAENSVAEEHAREKGFIFLAAFLLTMCFSSSLLLVFFGHRHPFPALVWTAASAIGLMSCAIRYAGYWPLPSLLFPRPNYSSRNLARAGEGGGGKTSAGSGAAPHFSRPAILGAVWSLFFALALGLWVITTMTFVGPWSNVAPRMAWWQWGLALTLLPLGVTAPLGTTLLGWIAVTQIRRSADRLYGLGLAVYDGLVFLLLALDALIGVGCFFLLHWAFDWSRHDPDGGMTIHTISFNLVAIVSLVVCLIVDILAIRWVWRVVNRSSLQSPDGGQPIEPKSKPVAAGSVHIASERWAARVRKGTVVLLALAVVGVIVMGVKRHLFSRASDSYDAYATMIPCPDSSQTNAGAFSVRVRKLDGRPVIAHVIRFPSQAEAAKNLEATTFDIAEEFDRHSRGIDRWRTDFCLLVGRRLGEKIAAPMSAAEAKTWFDNQDALMNNHAAYYAACQKIWEQYAVQRVAEFDRTNQDVRLSGSLGAGQSAEKIAGEILRSDYATRCLCRAMEILREQVMATRSQLPSLWTNDFDESLARRLRQIQNKYTNSHYLAFRGTATARDLLGLAGMVLDLRWQELPTDLRLKQKAKEQLEELVARFDQNCSEKLETVVPLKFVVPISEPIRRHLEDMQQDIFLPGYGIPLSESELTQVNQWLDGFIERVANAYHAAVDEQGQHTAWRTIMQDLGKNGILALRRIISNRARQHPTRTGTPYARRTFGQQSRAFYDAFQKEMDTANQVEDQLFKEHIRLRDQASQREYDEMIRKQKLEDASRQGDQ